jgi:Na+-translocating ferredoxin:NAD+ oxidoreductase RnfC subunit
MARALRGFPVTEKYVTVAGEVAKPVTLRVPLGTRISELIAAAGGATAEEVALISGGPMMGRLVTARDVVTKTTNAILVLPANHPVILNKKRNPKISLRRAMSVCCQCHSCTDLCSRHVIGYPVEPHLVMRVLSNGGRGDVEALEGSLYCSGCGLCETYSCPQGLSPRALIAELKATARREGYKPSDRIGLSEVRDAELRRVSVERLTMRLGLKKYDVAAPLCETGFETKQVKLSTAQHIGAPAVPCVAVGDAVRKGDVIARAAEGALSVNLHASIDGVVRKVTKEQIKIEAK